MSEKASENSVRQTLKTPDRKKLNRRERNRRYYLKRKATTARKTVLNVVAKKAKTGITVDAAMAESLGDSLFAYEARTYRGIVAAIVKKRQALGYTQAEVDELAGLQPGYCGKCEKPSASYGRIMGDMSFSTLLATLGLTIIITDIGYAKVALDHVKVTTTRRGAVKKGKKRC